MSKKVYLLLPVMFVLLACALPWLQTDELPSTDVPIIEPSLLDTATPTQDAPGATVTPTELVEEPAVPQAEPILTEKVIQKENLDPHYVLEVYYPHLEGVPRAVIFNQQIEGYIHQNIDSFTFDLEQLEGDWRKVESFYSVQYEITHQSPEWVSVLFTSSFYVAGAAHPGQEVHSENYDVALGRFFELPDLFIPGSNYLEVISSYCIEDLNNQGIDIWVEGASPEPKNFGTWNVKDEGLLISFPPYQVAPGAAGLLSVTVPFDNLQEVALPGGLLSAWLP